MTGNVAQPLIAEAPVPGETPVEALPKTSPILLIRIAVSNSIQKVLGLFKQKKIEEPIDPEVQDLRDKMVLFQGYVSVLDTLKSDNDDICELILGSKSVTPNPAERTPGIATPKFDELIAIREWVGKNFPKSTLLLLEKFSAETKTTLILNQEGFDEKFTKIANEFLEQLQLLQSLSHEIRHFAEENDEAINQKFSEEFERIEIILKRIYDPKKPVPKDDNGKVSIGTNAAIGRAIVSRESAEPTHIPNLLKVIKLQSGRTAEDLQKTALKIVSLSQEFFKIREKWEQEIVELQEKERKLLKSPIERAEDSYKEAVANLALADSEQSRTANELALAKKATSNANIVLKRAQNDAMAEDLDRMVPVKHPQNLKENAEKLDFDLNTPAQILEEAKENYQNRVAEEKAKNDVNEAAIKKVAEANKTAEQRLEAYTLMKSSVEAAAQEYSEDIQRKIALKKKILFTAIGLVFTTIAGTVAWKVVKKNREENVIQKPLKISKPEPVPSMQTVAKIRTPETTAPTLPIQASATQPQVTQVKKEPAKEPVEELPKILEKKFTPPPVVEDGSNSKDESPSMRGVPLEKQELIRLISGIKMNSLPGYDRLSVHLDRNTTIPELSSKIIAELKKNIKIDVWLYALSEDDRVQILDSVFDRKNPAYTGPFYDRKETYKSIDYAVSELAVLTEDLIAKKYWNVAKKSAK